jgi:hypothetical protein
VRNGLTRDGRTVFGFTAYVLRLLLRFRTDPHATPPQGKAGLQ